MEQRKPVIVVTGVSGRIGRAVASSFCKDYQVVGLDIVAPSFSCETEDFIQTDISRSESIKNAFAVIAKKYGKELVSVIHLAAYYNFEGGKWEKYQQITVEGTLHLLEALVDFRVEQFIFSSTLLVYAPCEPGEKITEDSALDPKWEYPLSKVKTEKLIAEKCSCPYVILRLAGIYTDFCHSIPISQQISRIDKKELESHFFPGNLAHGAAYLHMDDLVFALKLLVEKRKELKEREVFVLAEPDVVSYGKLQEEIGRLLYNKPWWTMRIPKLVAKVGSYFQNLIPFGKKTFIKPWMVDLADNHYEVGIGKAQRVLGWKPRHDLKNSLSKMVAALREDRQKWYQKHGL